MTERVRLSSRRRIILIVAGAASLFAATRLTAQIGGYPVDPADQQRATAQGSTGSRGNGTDPATSPTARNAADAQTMVVVTPSPYAPDEIADVTNVQTYPVPLDPRATAEPDRNARPLRRLPPPNEFEQMVSKMVGKPLRRLGAELLIPGARDFTTPPTTTVPLDYRINPGDELLLGLTGSVQASNLRLKVDSEGRVFVPRVGAISVAGVRYGDVQEIIARAVSRQYRSFRVAVSIGELHGITVYVTGYAAQPGSYTVSSLSTLVNAVLAAGGPSAGGSFRSIQVRRDGRLISDFDLYNLLLKGDKSADVVLQNGDVIYIAPAGAQVAVIGSVNVEAIYEARASETLYDMLLYAGGVNTVADDTRLLVLNAVRPQGWQELSPSAVRERTAERGEIIRVLSAIGIAQPSLTQPALVTVSGEVARPGRYYVQPGTPLSAVIERAGGLTSQAYPFGAVFTREAVRETQSESYDRALRDLELTLTTQPLITVRESQQAQPARLEAVRSVVRQLEERKPDGRLVLGIAPNDRLLPGDMVVENNDTIYVPPQPVTVGVFGAVPSAASFQYRPNMRVRDYLRQAGGFQKFADKSGVFVVRANGSLVAGGRGLGGNVMGARALPGDLIFVPVDSDRGEFWARLRDISSALLPAVLTGSAIAK